MGDDTLVAYCAGFLDGEGYVTTTGKTACRVKIDCVNPVPLFLFERRFGGTVKAYERKGNPKHRRYFRWDINGDAAREAVKTMMPYLTTKRDEARAVLQSAQHPSGTTVGDMLRDKAAQRRWEEY